MKEAGQICIKCLSHIGDNGYCLQCGVIYNFKIICRFCGSYQFGNPILECANGVIGKLVEVKNHTGICSNTNCFGYQATTFGFVVSNMFKRFPYNVYQERDREAIESNFVVYENLLIKVFFSEISPDPDYSFIHRSILNKLYKRFWIEEK